METKKRSKKIFVVIAIAVILFGMFAGFAIGVASRLALLEVFLSLAPTSPIFPKSNILVLGVDKGYSHRSDSIMVVHVDPDKRAVGVVSIPRDTLVTIPGRGLDKVNHAFAYGGVELARLTVEEFLGIKIPYFVTVDLTGVEEIIDKIGGVEVNVPKRMYYVDYADDLRIDLQPGRQKLNGHQVMGYLRFRHSDNDFSRINRQQDFVKTVGKQLMRRENILQSPDIFFTLLGCIETNLNSRQVLGLSLALRGAEETGQIGMTTVQGSSLMVDGIYYFKPDAELLRSTVGSYLKKERE
ncbi:MAG: LCP family protein [Candidatus Margulisiibacteriota bacterium]